MDPTELMSQIIFPLAALLFVSSILKLFSPITWGERLGALFEGIVAIGAVLMSQFDLEARFLAIGTMALLYGLYLGYVVYGFYKKSTAPCICFGSLSIKPARVFSVARNALLFVSAILACFTEANGISIVGVLLTIVVLGAILFEEIR